MVVAPAALAAAAEDVFLVLFHQFGDYLFRFCILNHHSLGYFQDDIGPVLALFQGLGAVTAVFGPHHFAVAQVDEGPQLRIHPQDDVTAPAAVAAVGAALGHILGPVQMGTAGASVPAGAKDADVVYEVGFCHGFYRFACKFTVFSSVRKTDSYSRKLFLTLYNTK